MRIVRANLRDDQVVDLLGTHLLAMRANSPAESVHALALDSLHDPQISLYAAWEKHQLLGLAALKELSANQGELKSMRTHANHLRKGVAQALLIFLIEQAKTKGYVRLSLETGSGIAFDAAIRLYLKHGFEFGDKFSNYEDTDFNRFLHLNLC